MRTPSPGSHLSGKNTALTVFGVKTLLSQESWESNGMQSKSVSGKDSEADENPLWRFISRWSFSRPPRKVNDGFVELRQIQPIFQNWV